MRQCQPVVLFDGYDGSCNKWAWKRERFWADGTGGCQRPFQAFFRNAASLQTGAPRGVRTDLRLAVCGVLQLQQSLAYG